MTSRFPGRSALAAMLAVALIAPSAASQAPTKPVSLPGSYDGGYLVFQSADSAFKYWLDGRMQIDAAVYNGSKNGLSSGTEVRRARLGVKTTLFTDWHAEMDLDFAFNAIEIKDMWVAYAGFPNKFIRIGNFKEPFSLETLTSSKNITFMERSYADNFSPDRNIGASLTQWGNRWEYSVGLFGQTAGEVDVSARPEGYGFTGRFSFLPVKSDANLLHLGFGASQRTPDAGAPADANQVRFRGRPETDVSLARFVTTGKIKNVRLTNYWNGELAYMHGRTLLQAEYTGVNVHRLAALKTAGFSGGYVALSQLLTDDKRDYLVADGEFDRIQPKGKRGAWELAARVSVIDLNDPTAGVAIAGGRATNVTLGVNWYINTNFKWMFNYVRVMNDDNAKPDIGIAPFQTGDSFNILQTRFALAF